MSAFLGLSSVVFSTFSMHSLCILRSPQRFCAPGGVAALTLKGSIVLCSGKRKKRNLTNDPIWVKKNLLFGKSMYYCFQ